MSGYKISGSYNVQKHFILLVTLHELNILYLDNSYNFIIISA